ncbi:helix-turn-helix transcriptional regulator [Gordonia sp. PS3]|uniref:helix-turn-helix transcriptional regulator n=1 Tax=unclassified Gordonia (in: high G+C Gram-positive bacteria) TaxID=2657482 RepID=UPI00078109BA|nr:helix-turn-helix domain-containing protein [Gordonia sp. QH-12]KXT58885.1 transcriptional regulator [Gordonia sp. QH-12]
MRTTILDTLRAAAAPMTVAEVAEATDIPQTTVRFHLRALTADGLIVVDTAAHDGPGRPRLLYRARPAMDPSGPRNYGVLAEVLLRTLADTPDAPARAVAAGREWGAAGSSGSDEPVEDLLAVLDDLGFAPEAAGDRIRLNRCPFLELARRQPALTCSVHRGIVQGVLSRHHTDLRLERLDAFVDGDHCLAVLAGGRR